MATLKAVNPSLAVVFGALTILACQGAHAGDAVRHVPLNVPVGATSIDFQTTGDVANAQGMPKIKDSKGHMVNYGNNWGFGAPDSGTGLSNNSIQFPDGLPAGRYTMDVPSSNGWPRNFSIWYDGPALPPPFVGVPNGGTFASLYLTGDPNHSILVGENVAGTATASVGSITVTVVSGFSSFFSDNWLTAPGTDLNFAGGTIAAGADGVKFGSLSYGPDEWVRITADIDGTPYAAAFTPTPEPSSAVLLGIGVPIAGLGIAVRRRFARRP
jgi:hypothetical protein